MSVLRPALAAPEERPAPEDGQAPLLKGPSAYDRWRAQSLIGRVFEVETDPHRFRSRVDYRGLGSVVALTFEMSEARHSRSSGRVRRDGLDMIWVQLAQTGGFSGASPGRDIAAGAGTAALCDFSVAVEQHSVVSTGSALLIPREAFAQADPRLMHATVVKGGRYQLLSDYVHWLCAQSAAGRTGNADTTARAVGQVIAACFGSAGPFAGEVAGALGPLALQRARRFISERLADPEVRTDDIARAAGVSRATLYRLCAPLGGVAELVWSLRLEAARRAMNDPDRPGRISDFADAYGFISAQHFSRRFRQTFGFSPRNLRPF